MAFDASSTTHLDAAQPGIARLRLREATAPDHGVVDAAYAAFDLSRPSEYRAFLEAQLACFRPLEEALTAAGAERLFADWPARQRAGAIIADLADLGASEPSVPQLDFAPALSSDAAILGSLYVLEGSRFGGAVLARNLPPQMPKRFLAAASDAQAWRDLLAAMDRELASEPAIEAAITAARAVFAAFEAAARVRLETAVD